MTGLAIGASTLAQNLTSNMRIFTVLRPEYSVRSILDNAFCLTAPKDGRQHRLVIVAVPRPSARPPSICWFHSVAWTINTPVLPFHIIIFFFFFLLLCLCLDRQGFVSPKRSSCLATDSILLSTQCPLKLPRRHRSVDGNGEVGTNVIQGWSNPDTERMRLLDET